MESTLVKYKNGIGSLILILGCPLKEKHTISDPPRNLSGPGFADCAYCRYQAGINLQILSEDGNIIEAFPERLRCGILEKKRDEEDWLKKGIGYLSNYLSGKRVAILGQGV